MTRVRAQREIRRLRHLESLPHLSRVRGGDITYLGARGINRTLLVVGQVDTVAVSGRDEPGVGGCPATGPAPGTGKGHRCTLFRPRAGREYTLKASRSLLDRFFTQVVPRLLMLLLHCRVEAVFV